MEHTNLRQSRPKARQSLAHVPSASRLSALEKQNATIDLSASRTVRSSDVQSFGKRARGKSIGPGGLEALKESNGNAVKNGPSLQPRSILKPTVPLTPPKGIPTFDELRQRSTRKKSPAKGGTEALLIDFSTPGPNFETVPNLVGTDAPDALDPFSPIKVPKLNGDAEGDHVVDEQERQRKEQKKAILEQRAARRKSMANRRVSFAPEATLHTWSVMELVEDSTTSSASNSTRRQSSMTAQQTPHKVSEPQTPGLEASDPPSTPPEQTEEPTVRASPAHQRDLHQKKRRRSSAVSVDGEGSGDEIFSSSPSSDVAGGSSPMRIEDGIESDSDTDGDTAMSIDEPTQNTMQSNASGSSTHSSLDNRLKLAASQAGTRGIEYDEHGDDVSMDMADDTITKAFQPWAKDRHSANDNQENIIPGISSVQGHQAQRENNFDEADMTEEMTMEMTRAVGGIVGTSANQKSRRKSAVAKRSSIGRRQSIAAESSFGDETMDFTTIAGGILPSRAERQDDTSESMAEDVTMEFTTAFGGVNHERDLYPTLPIDEDENKTMEMTTAVGGILAPIEEQTEPQTDIEDDATIAMETTKAIGQILTRNAGPSVSLPSKNELATTTKVEDLSSASTSSLQIDGEVFESTPKHRMSVASETGSPSLALKQRSSGRSRAARVSQITTPLSSTRTTPQKTRSAQKQATPTKQLTPVPTKAKSVERTPVMTHVVHRGSSPKKLFQAEIQARSSPASAKKSAKKQQDLLFAQDSITGRHTPRVVLHAPERQSGLRRRSSGLGIDKEGFGSPSVTQLLARRSSIGDAATQFKFDPSQTPRLRFEDPKQLGEDLDAQRAEDQRRESGRFVMEQEANEQQDENATLQLKDMIESMTPRKNNVGKLKGRKSLAVGSARGVLGKRPIELDSEDEDADGTPKRLKAVSREGSPVKNIHLPKPPTKEETTGRLNKLEQMSTDYAQNGENTPTMARFSSKMDGIGSPQQIARFRDVSQGAPVERPTTFEEKLDNVVGAIDPSIAHPPSDRAPTEEDKISLQQFLNMTNIHFIELNTTKRRHTMAQSVKTEMADAGYESSSSARACFVAAATTMPLLELYQHATRELKSYISTGRKIIRSIENETLAEQPALFREYVDARADVKLVMDNQFRNGKINARLQSREGWYSWRSQLVDGLQSGLESIQNDMKQDLDTLREQVQAIAQVVPELTDHHDDLSKEVSLLGRRLEEIDSIDHDALKTSREDLRDADAELQSKLAALEALQQQMIEKDEVLAQAAELQNEMKDQIKEANRVREEHHEWKSNDVLLLKTSVDAITKQHGWSVLSAEDDDDQVDGHGIALTMSYKQTLRLFFHPAAYQVAAASTPSRSGRARQSIANATAPISLTYCPYREDDVPVSSLSTEERFFLQLMQSHLHANSMLPKGSVPAKTITEIISSGWEMALKVTEEIRLLSFAGIVRTSIQGDDKLAMKLVLMTATQGRVDFDFTLHVTVSNDALVCSRTSVDVSAIYGAVANILDVAKTRKVQIALTKEIESRNVGEGAWAGAVQAFEDWLSNQKQPQKPAVSRPKKTEVTASEEPAAGSTTPKSPAVTNVKTPATRRSPLAMKKTGVMQKKTIPVATSRQDKFRISQREQAPSAEACPVLIQEATKGKENIDPFVIVPGAKAPAITPEMQEAMMQRTPIKRVGALRRSPI